MDIQNSFMQGFSITGVCKGIKVSVSGQYTNHDLGISVQSPDGFGGFIENITYVTVFGESLNRLQNQVDMLKGKLVTLPVVVQSKKSERTGNAYQRVFPQQNALMIEINSNQLKKVG